MRIYDRPKGIIWEVILKRELNYDSINKLEMQHNWSIYRDMYRVNIFCFLLLCITLLFSAIQRRLNWRS